MAAYGVESFEERSEADAHESKDWEKEGYPWTLWHLYVHEMQVQESHEVVNAAVILLAASGVEQEWQLLEMTQEDLERVLPQESHMKEYLATKYVISKLRRRGKGSSEMKDMVEAVLKMGKDIKASQPKRKRGPFDSDSEDERKEQFNATGMLEPYGLDGVPHDHMPRNAFMEKVAKKAVAATNGKKKFLAPGNVVDYWPQWMRDPPKAVDQCQTHAHWCAAWWSRALTQLASQSAVERETVSSGTLLTGVLEYKQGCHPE